jgi:protein gp37
MSDLFHEKVTDETLLALFTVMANSHIATGITKTHTFQILTKREERMLDFCQRLKWKIGMGFTEEIRPDGSIAVLPVNNMPFLDTLDPWNAMNKSGSQNMVKTSAEWMPPQIHLGVSVEDESNAEKRIPQLLRTPAVIRFVSYEPALGPVNFRPWLGRGALGDRGLDWGIAGGESGPNARPPNPDWFRRARDDFKAAGVPFLFKQWGDWSPEQPENWIKISSRRYSHETAAWTRDGSRYNPLDPPPGHFPDVMMYRVGKGKAGRLLDGREWNEMP